MFKRSSQDGLEIPCILHFAGNEREWNSSFHPFLTSILTTTQPQTSVVGMQPSVRDTQPAVSGTQPDKPSVSSNQPAVNITQPSALVNHVTSQQ